MQTAEPTRQKSRLGHWRAVIGRKVFFDRQWNCESNLTAPPPRKFITRVVFDTRFILALFLCSCVPYTSLMENGIVGYEGMVALEACTMYERLQYADPIATLLRFASCLLVTF